MKTNLRKILIASDHAGFELKQQFIKNNPDLPWEDLGPANLDSVDYPDFAHKLCENLLAVTNKAANETTHEKSNEDALDIGTCGILICGSGQGMAIAANKHAGIRAALCWNEDLAKLSRQHNNANILCVGSRTVTAEMAQRILETFLGSAFEGGRHSQRVAKITI